MGRKSKKEGICVYVWLIHFAVQQKLTQQCKATILQKKKNCKKTTNKFLLKYSLSQVVKITILT